MRRLLTELEVAARARENIPFWSLLASGGLLLSAALYVMLAALARR